MGPNKNFKEKTERDPEIKTKKFTTQKEKKNSEHTQKENKTKYLCFAEK